MPKIVFSRTLETVEGNARLVRGGVAEEVARLKKEPGKDVTFGGAGLASTFIRLGPVDEYRLFVSPVVLGGGTRYFPALEERINLELVETRTFGSRVVYVRYRRAGYANRSDTRGVVGAILRPNVPRTVGKPLQGSACTLLLHDAAR